MLNPITHALYVEDTYTTPCMLHTNWSHNPILALHTAHASLVSHFALNFPSSSFFASVSTVFFFFAHYRALQEGIVAPFFMRD